MSSRGNRIPQLNRRELGKRLAGAVVAVPAVAQVTQKTPPIGAPAPAQPPATPEQQLRKAYDDVHSISDQLSKLELPMDIEPAFSFRS
jgi:hypothetical protein